MGHKYKKYKKYGKNNSGLVALLVLLWLRASFSRREKQENHQLCWWLPRL